MDQPNTPDRADLSKPAADATRPELPRRPADPIQAEVPSRPANAPPAEAPLTPAAFLRSNGLVLVGAAIALVALLVRFGPDLVLRGAIVIVGLGFVIFIHELGHFLAAKWCDVHVTTFSIGFGPALPGCSFTRGETTYKIAMLPLGGYVNMVGEGPEADEDESYPRSFKNKSVGARMLIISAGVIMNVIFGAICFIIVYRYYGVLQTPAVVSLTDPGSVAWKEGVRPGWKLVKIGDKDNPSFEEMKVKVALSAAGRPITFVFQDSADKLHHLEMEPFKDANSPHPLIGIAAQSQRLRLLPARAAKEVEHPVRPNTAAAAARVLELQRGDQLVKATDPEKGTLTPLPSGKDAWAELARRMTAAGEKPMQVEVRRGGRTLPLVDVPAAGFAFDDDVIATTNPNTPDEPFNIEPLPPDPNQDPDDPTADSLKYRTRMRQLAGRPVVVRVLRDGQPVHLFVPPAYHRTLGLVLKMGKVAALRKDSPAARVSDERKRLRPGDEIVGVSLARQGEKPVPLNNGKRVLDPLRLPDELARRVAADTKAKWWVTLRVKRTADHDADPTQELAPIPWDPSWSTEEEVPLGESSPLSIPQLGIAYWVESQVVHVEPGSPAAEAGIGEGDLIVQARFLEAGSSLEKPKWSPWWDLKSQRGNDREVYDRGAHFFWLLQGRSQSVVEFKLQRKGEPAAPDGPITARPDPSWPAVDRGERFTPDRRTHKADSFAEALQLGLDRTRLIILQIYQSLQRLLTGRVSTKSLGGPIEIFAQGFGASEDLVNFFIFLGVISINLAVVNFLPIPVLDGGHMVFLIYEKLRGRPPSEGVRLGATYLGLAMILSLMVFVFWLDIKRRFL